MNAGKLVTIILIAALVVVSAGGTNAAAPVPGRPAAEAAAGALAWHIQTLDDAIWGGASLALDAVGRPHITYYDDTGGEMKYAWGEWRCFIYLPLLCRGCVTPAP
jgi:hypothetical protein